MSKDYYSVEVQRAYQHLMTRMEQEELLTTAIAKIRGSYGDAVANGVQDKIAKTLLNAERVSV